MTLYTQKCGHDLPLVRSLPWLLALGIGPKSLPWCWALHGLAFSCPSVLIFYHVLLHSWSSSQSRLLAQSASYLGSLSLVFFFHILENSCSIFHSFIQGFVQVSPIREAFPLHIEYQPKALPRPSLFFFACSAPLTAVNLLANLFNFGFPPLDCHSLSVCYNSHYIKGSQ
jgi:hypothetical protein